MVLFGDGVGIFRTPSSPKLQYGKYTPFVSVFVAFRRLFILCYSVFLFLVTCHPAVGARCSVTVLGEIHSSAGVIHSVAGVVCLVAGVIHSVSWACVGHFGACLRHLNGI